ncbi:hypothetical protein EG863_15635, partial [Enterococcus faecalis]
LDKVPLQQHGLLEHTRQAADRVGAGHRVRRRHGRAHAEAHLGAAAARRALVRRGGARGAGFGVGGGGGGGAGDPGPDLVVVARVHLGGGARVPVRPVLAVRRGAKVG